MLSFFKKVRSFAPNPTSSFSSRLAASKTLSPGSINPFENLIRRIQFPLRIRGSDQVIVHNRHNHHCFPVGWTHSFINTPHAIAELQIHAFDGKQSGTGYSFNIQNGGFCNDLLIVIYAVKSAVIVRYRTRFRQCELHVIYIYVT